MNACFYTYGIALYKHKRTAYTIMHTRTAYTIMELHFKIMTTSMIHNKKIIALKYFIHDKGRISVQWSRITI
jgi:hypothetical protein